MDLISTVLARANRESESESDSDSDEDSPGCDKLVFLETGDGASAAARVLAGASVSDLMTVLDGNVGMDVSGGPLTCSSGIVTACNDLHQGRCYGFGTAPTGGGVEGGRVVPVRNNFGGGHVRDNMGGVAGMMVARDGGEFEEFKELIKERVVTFVPG